MPKITEFTIDGLHGRVDVRIPIKDNKLVLIGHNGLGKSTVATILYYFLSRQWRKLSTYSFQSISLKVGTRRLKIDREQISNHLLLRRPHLAIQRFFPPSILTRLQRSKAAPILEKLALGRPLTGSEWSFVSREGHIPISRLRDIERIVRREYGTRHSSDAEFSLFGDEDGLTKLGEEIGNRLPGQIMFLPTYRRIERDLDALFPELEEEIRKFTRQREHEDNEVSFIEYIQFGMEDVERRISRILSNLKETARSELNNLAGTYLRDVVREQASKYDESLIQSLDDSTVEKILDRVEEKTLTQEDKSLVRDAINRIKTSRAGAATDTDRYIAHFFGQMAMINEEISKSEMAITNYMKICNDYLYKKRFYYDDINFEMYVSDAAMASPESKIELSDLSSGEKQIVSLFAHLLLSGRDDYYLIIDEPELSLSVDWQTTLLPDILSSGTANLLVAVTHSPFIFDNELNEFTVDLGECVRPVS